VGFGVIAPCGILVVFHCFGRTLCLHLQGRSVSMEAACFSETLKYVRPEDCTTQRRGGSHLAHTAVKTSNRRWWVVISHLRPFSPTLGGGVVLPASYQLDRMLLQIKLVLPCISISVCKTAWCRDVGMHVCCVKGYRTGVSVNRNEASFLDFNCSYQKNDGSIAHCCIKMRANR
jgi:hypothetical protein